MFKKKKMFLIRCSRCNIHSIRKSISVVHASPNICVVDNNNNDFFQFRQLFDVLSHPVVTGRCLPVLLACNKADAGTKAHTVDFIRKRLEKELDQIRQTRGTLADQAENHSSTHASSSSYAVLGNSAPGTFTFAGLGAKGPLVTCASVSAVDTGGVSDVEAFIRKCMPK